MVISQQKDKGKTMDKLEKQKLKLQEKRRRERNKQIQKSAKRLGDRLERMTVFFGVFLCLHVTVMDVLEARERNAQKDGGASEG